MSQIQKEHIQVLEGPWRLEATMPATNLNELLPGGTRDTARDMYDQRYGASNWKEDTAAHNLENQLGHVATRNEYGLVDEAQRNLAEKGEYVTDDGTNARPLERRAWTDLVDVIVSPDGDAYAAARTEDQKKS